MHGWTHARTDNVKTVYPLQTKFAGGIIINAAYRIQTTVTIAELKKLYSRVLPTEPLRQLIEN